MLENIERYTQSLATYDSYRSNLEESGKKVEELVAYHTVTVRSNLLRAECQEKKTQSQIAVVITPSLSLPFTSLTLLRWEAG